MRFADDQIRLFRHASLDNNPLHSVDHYARKTPFGEPVVYGTLACLAMLGKVRAPRGCAVSRITVDFKSPVFKRIDYQLAIREESSTNVVAALMDGSVVVLRMAIHFRKGAAEEFDFPERASVRRTEPRRLEPSLLTPGLSFVGQYDVDRQRYQELLDTLGVDRSEWGDALPMTLLCTSYLTGMELPGEAALYTTLKAEILPERSEGSTDFTITLSDFDDRFGIARSHFALARSSSTPYARGEISSTVRMNCGPAALVGESAARFSGKTVVIVGASRGLGAALSLTFAAEGASVIGVYSRSDADAAELEQKSRSLAGSVIMKRGNAADPSWCQSLKERIATEFGHLDVLVCNAAPALQSVRLEAEYYERICRYVNHGFSLVAAPLTAFLDVVSRVQGSVLLVSSAAVETSPPGWPHYVAMKAAAEGLITAAAASHQSVRFWIARPAKIATEFTNTPMGRIDAEEPGSVARRIVNALATPSSSGEVVTFR
jgi:NAD(P)-dependent dehydrogenase (short-subunit alcohol dehydrogenase family)